MKCYKDDETGKTDKDVKRGDVKMMLTCDAETSGDVGRVKPTASRMQDVMRCKMNDAETQDAAQPERQAEANHTASCARSQGRADDHPAPPWSTTTCAQADRWRDPPARRPIARDRGPTGEAPPPFVGRTADDDVVDGPRRQSGGRPSSHPGTRGVDEDKVCGLARMLGNSHRDPPNGGWMARYHCVMPRR